MWLCHLRLILNGLRSFGGFDMNAAKLKEIIALHKLFLDGEEGGECANLSDTNLSDTNLSDTNLIRANLSCANLSSSVGFLLLPCQDPRGYSFPHAIECAGKWRIRAGCRDFSIAEAREHWGENYDGDRDQGDMYLYAIDWLEKKTGGETRA